MKPELTPIGPDYPTEAAFKSHVVKRARHLGWRVYHHPDSRRSPYDDGFPDLVMARQGRLLIVECKTDIGRFSQDQADWIDVLESVPCIVVALWRPMHHLWIEEELQCLSSV